jgi:hypothetical protein
MGKKLPQEQMRNPLDRLDKKGDPDDPAHDLMIARIMGLAPQKASPPDDMPALEKIKIYARSGYNLHHIGTDADFERVWAEAFPAPEK